MTSKPTDREMQEAETAGYAARGLGKDASIASCPFRSFTRSGKALLGAWSKGYTKRHFELHRESVQRGDTRRPWH